VIFDLADQGPTDLVNRTFTSGSLRYVDVTSALWEPLQFPLLFPHAEAGWWQERGGKQAPCTLSTKGTRLSMHAYYRSRILRPSHFHQLSSLFQEYILDGYSRWQEKTLHFLRSSAMQTKFRVAPRASFARAASNSAQKSSAAHPGVGSPSHEGMKQYGSTFLPASVPGSPACQRALVEDGLAVVRRHGMPTLFITITCNPYWPEIMEALHPGQSAFDRPDIVARVFQLKLRILTDGLRDGSYFGVDRRCSYYIRVTEFQKRGLPHAHIAAQLAGH
jgi:hypothetical protein